VPLLFFFIHDELTALGLRSLLSNRLESKEFLPIMRLKFLVAILAPCTFCAGQSVLTTPVSVTESIPATAAAPDSSAGQTPPQRPTTDSDYPRQETREPMSPATPTATDRTTAPSSLRIVGPLRTKSEFERYAEDATGRRLPVYGRQLFDQVPTTFAPVENAPVPADYVLGPGDQLLIRAWGKIDLDSRVTIDRNGQINLPRVGTLTVAGLRYSEIEGFLHSALSALFKDFNLNVSLGQLRSIQIFVLGDARQPGAYTVSSLSTLVDALFTSGGPSATGTMRRIQLRRAGLTVTEFDLYDLIEKGDKSHDIHLLPGDVIFIPPVGPQVAVSGDVNRPGIYELREKATIGSALEIAGGVTSLADTERAVLERIDNHSSRTVEECALDAEGEARPLKDGDLLRVFPLSPKFANAVTLRGSVAQPGLYSWKNEMRVSDLIPSRTFLITRDYWNQQNHLVRPQSGNPFVDQTTDAPNDDLTDAYGNPSTDTYGNPRSDAYGNRRSDAYDDQRSDLSDAQRTESFGGQRTDRSDAERTESFGNRHPDASANPGNRQSNDTGDAIITSIGQNTAEINWEYAVIERLDEHDLSTRLIPFRLASAIDDPSSTDNQLLKPGDVVTIFSRADLELPMEKHASFVRIGGEVNAPGVYRVNPGDTLRDVVTRAGGLTSHSYLYASIFTRVSTRKAQEAQLRQSAEEMQSELASRYANATPQMGQTGADQQAQLAMQQASLAQLTAIKPTGRVVLSMKPDADSLADVPSFPLEDGDAFYVPPRLSTVQVTGAVYNTNAFRYKPGDRLIRYLNAAGGATRQADQKRLFVIRADGTVVSRQSRNLHIHGGFENLHLLPGDAIVVPEKLRGSSKMTDFVQTTQFMSQLAVTAAALNVIR
jgi:polysaccharide export outer membrane protein